MECTKCHNIGELMPKRSICRPCYNEEKRVQRNARAEKRKDKQEQCSVCSEIKILVNGSRWCRECRNKHEREKKQQLTTEEREAVNERERERYKDIKEGLKNEPMTIDPMALKTCTICRVEQTMDNYYINKCKGTVRAECKECSSKTQKERYLRRKLKEQN